VDKGQTVTQTFILVFPLTHDSLKVDRTTMNVNGIVINKYGCWLFKKSLETSVGDIADRHKHYCTLIFLLAETLLSQI
jgi:hypothetical protein